MLYGKNIAQFDIQVEGLLVTSQIRTENPNYVFITVETREKKPGKYPIRV
jgi:neopullulanase